MALVVKSARRQVGHVLKSKTSGVLHGAKMVDFRRPNWEGTFSVQVVAAPELPEGITGFDPNWFKEYVLSELVLPPKYVKEDTFLTSAMTEHIICLESGTRFMKYGYYRRVFAKSDGMIVKDGTDGAEVCYLNLWTGAVDPTCTYASVQNLVS